ncbi:MAG: hypothetical protein AAFQ61_09310 [Cyanobacteria bacterium J06626_23]
MSAANLSELPNFDNLRLSPTEIDTLTGLDIGELSMGRATRLSLFHHPRRLGLWVVTLLMTLGVTLVLCVPVVLVLARSFAGSAETAVMLRYLPVGAVSAIALTAGWQGYTLYQGQQLKTLDHLLEEVEHYNEMLTAVEVYSELAAAKGQAASLENAATVIEALHLTRENLVNGLTTERVMRKHQRFMAQKQALFSRIEHNLSALQALQIVDTASEYGTLLNEALQIGTQVHKELQALSRYP